MAQQKPDLRLRVVSILTDTLKRYLDNEIDLNALLVDTLKEIAQAEPETQMSSLSGKTVVEEVRSGVIRKLDGYPETIPRDSATR